MKKTFTLILAVFVSLSVFAQKRIDLFSVSGNYNFLESTATNSQNYESGIMVNLNIPIVLKDSSIWYTSIDYQNFSVPTNSTTYTNLDNFNLNGFILKTGLIIS